MEDEEATPRTNDKGKEPTMEQLYTLGSLEIILSLKNPKLVKMRLNI